MNHIDPVTKASTLSTSTPPDKIPNILLTPIDWAVEAQKRAADYLGMQESTWFTVEARRYMALNAELERLRVSNLQLESELDELKDFVRRSNGND